MARSYSGRHLPRSWSSIRSSTVPPVARAIPQVHTALETWPRCRYPVGLGAKRVAGRAGRLGRAMGGIGCKLAAPATLPGGRASPFPAIHSLETREPDVRQPRIGTLFGTLVVLTATPPLGAQQKV